MVGGCFEGSIHFPNEEEKEVWCLRYLKMTGGCLGLGKIFFMLPLYCWSYKVKDKLRKN